MNPPDPSTWRAFNFLQRLLGFGATFAGTAVVVTAGFGYPPIAGQPSTLDWSSLASGGLVALIGLGFLMNSPFRPDLGDTGMPINPLRPRAGRSWWTGDERVGG
ncbi:MAG: hypothetical protein ABI587_10390 [Gemmatimonadales bacterium]